MATRTWRLTALCALLVGVTLSPPLTALGSASHATSVTFTQGVRIPGASLPAGTYIFEVAAPGSDVVRVMTGDRSRSLFLGFTRPVTRSDIAARSTVPVTLGEAPAGSPRPVDTWWPTGDQLGHSFIYR